MRKSVENYIRQCDACVKRKTPALTASNGTAPLQSLQVSEPFTFWALDYMGPLPETNRGNKHILVLMDHFTKWCEPFPMPYQKASTVTKILVRVFSRFGPPVVLHSDLWLNAVVFAYNTSRQESLQTSPFEIVFGRIPRLPLELGLPLKDPSMQSEYTQSLRKIFKEVREEGRQNLEKARKKQEM